MRLIRHPLLARDLKALVEHILDATGGDIAAAGRRLDETEAMLRDISSNPFSGTRRAPPLDGWQVRHGGRGHRLTIEFHADADRDALYVALVTEARPPDGGTSAPPFPAGTGPGPPARLGTGHRRGNASTSRKPVTVAGCASPGTATLPPGASGEKITAACEHPTAPGSNAAESQRRAVRYRCDPEADWRLRE